MVIKRKLVRKLAMVLAIAAMTGGVAIAPRTVVEACASCIHPSHESSAVAGEFLVTVSAFRQNVWDDASHNFNGFNLTEGTPSPVPNGCFYTGAPFPSNDAVSGGYWTVASADPNGITTNGNNQWGTDLDGDSLEHIRAVRQHHALPCTEITPQTMYSSTTCGIVWWPYFSNDHTNTITATRVENCRAGKCDKINVR